MEKKYTPKKNNHTQDNIYVVWQFAYIHRVAGISLFLVKNTKCGSMIFLSKKWHQNPNLQNNSFYFLRTGFTNRPKPPLHGPSLRKSPIKNYNNIILGRVIIQIKYN